MVEYVGSGLVVDKPMTILCPNVMGKQAGVLIK